jgi:hypothetical protein
MKPYASTAAAASLFLLSACMGAASEPPAPVATPEPVAPAPVVVETPAVVEEAPPPLPAPEPDRLLGLTPSAVQAIMGEPSFVRRDDRMQSMLFEAGDCVFELIFMEPSSDLHFEVKKLSARAKTGAPTDTQACLVRQLPNGQWLDAGAGEP